MSWIFQRYAKGMGANASGADADGKGEVDKKLGSSPGSLPLVKLLEASYERRCESLPLRALFAL